jgi:hypothetical protein
MEKQSYRGFTIERKGAVTFEISNGGKVLDTKHSVFEAKEAVNERIARSSMKTVITAKGLNTSDVMGLSMPKPVKKEPETMPRVEETKSEPVEPFAVDEEKDERHPEHPLNEEPAMNKEPEPAPEVDINVNEDEEFEHALKAISGRFDRQDKYLAGINESLKALVEMQKANYTSKPPSKDSDYPTPGVDGPLSDGVRGPKLTQSVNPAQKPFGKEIAKERAVAGVPDAAASPGGVSDKTRYLEQVLKGEIKLGQVPARLKMGGN